MRISPGVGVRTIAKVPLRRGEIDTEFDQDELAKLLDQQPFNMAVANLYKTRFNGVPGVVYAAGVRHAYNLAEAFRAENIKAQAVSGETPKRELVEILARYERGRVGTIRMTRFKKSRRAVERTAAGPRRRDAIEKAMDDDELIAAVAGGDDVALRELFLRHAPWLAARLGIMLPVPDVEDVLQETFLAVWRGAGGYRPGGTGGGGGFGGSPAARPHCGCAATGAWSR